MNHSPLVNVYRGSQVESTHSGSVVVVESTGRILAVAGDPNTRTFLRSAAKPFQTVPLLEEGGSDEFDLTGQELALMCGSHGGEPIHVSTASAILRKGDFDESDLLCGAHMPYDDKAVAELRQTGERPTVLHNNCSGKHAGMLLATRLLDASTAGYIDADHPLQIRIRQTLADFAGVHPEDIPVAIDGCSVPSFYLSLYRTALAYARLAASAQGADAPGALTRHVESSRMILEAMTSFPEYVAGRWSITTRLMQAFGGQLLAKEGAEGCYSMAMTPELAVRLTDRLQLADDSTVAIALKIADGSMARGRNPVILRTLELLGIDVSELPELHNDRDTILRNYAGLVVGDVRAEFELEFL